MSRYGGLDHLVVSLLLWLANGSAFAQQQSAISPSVRAMREEARLNDVFFLDAQRGWAVGDLGVIWRTTDGGGAWTQQNSGVTCRLESVCFVSPEVGWAAGGEFTPYAHTSRGVMLRTRDGGRTWDRDKSIMMPGLKRVKFFNLGQGWAFGDASPAYGSGLFTTDNGGAMWTPVKGRAGDDWIAGDFTDFSRGAAVTRHGVPTGIDRRIFSSESPAIGLRSARDVRLDPRGAGWMVGDGGLVLRSFDQGRNWAEVPTLPPELSRTFDWRTVEATGSHCWVAGNPGTKVLHSPDAGKSWELFETGQATPWEAMDFVSEEQGWAVGALGAIFATQDGGRTWRKQRAGGERVAVAGFFSDASAAPLEAIASLGANEGYQIQISFLNRHDLDPAEGNEAGRFERARDTVSSAGGSGGDTAWSFPVRENALLLPADRILEVWNQVQPGDAQARLEEYIVREIRAWRPELVTTHAQSLRGDDPLASLICQAVLSAANKAGDPAEFVEQQTIAGLKPWKVSRIVGSLSAGQPGEINVSAGRFADRIGETFSSFTLSSRALVDHAFAAPPSTNGFCVYRDNGGVADHRHLMSGLSRATDARRLLFSASSGAEDLRRAGLQQRNLQAILDRAPRDGADPARLLAAIGELTGGLQPDAAAQTIFQLASSLVAHGEWRCAAATLDLYATSYPDHAYVDSANLWLLRYWGSAEAGLFDRNTAPNSLASSSKAGGGAVLVASGFEAAKFATRQQGGAGVPQQTAATSPTADGNNLVNQQRLAKALEIAARINTRHPLSTLEPATVLTMASIQRRGGSPQSAEKSLSFLESLPPENAWRASGMGERWLLRRAAAPPKPVITLKLASMRPKLDGDLSDELWRDAATIELQSAVPDMNESPGAVLIAYDADFLYVAFDCHSARSTPKPSESSRPRTRDADLSAHDRVELLLDVDRDGGACFRLSVDHRGCAADDCFDAARWNAEWYVASRGDARHWTAEMAIALPSLTREAIAPGEAWGLGVQRVAPGVGFQSWTQPAAISIRPEGFGYLLFE